MSLISYSASNVQISQVLLRMHYRELARRQESLPRLADVEFRCHSQNGEDGILLYIFSLLPSGTRTVVEICAGEGIECNAANLLVNHGWRGLLIDGDDAQLARGREFYATCRTTQVSPPTLLSAWVTAENVNELVSSQGFAGEIDLLSVDLDGNDYWIWKALDCAQPRVVVVEFNAAVGPDDALTMSYDPDYRLDFGVRPYRCGASLPAFVKLARSKGYRLAGIQSLGFNAFFVRNGVADGLLPEMSPQECYRSNERLRGWSPVLRDSIIVGGEPWEAV